MNYIDLFLGALVSVYFYIYIIKNMFRQDFKVNLFFLGLVVIIISITNFYNKDIFKLYLTLPILIFYFTFITKVKIEKSFFFVLTATLYLFIGEIFTGFLFVFISHNYSFIFENIMGRTIGSLLVFIFSVPFTKIKFISDFFKRLENKLNIKKLISIGIITVTIIGAISYKNTHSIDNIVAYITNIVLYVMALLLIWLYLREIYKKRALETEYSNLIKYLEKYEKEIEEKRKLVHDFNNQIIVINGYVERENTKLKDYLKEIIKDQRKNKSNNFIDGLSEVPIGLKGLIYYKFVSIYENINLCIEAKNMKKYESISPYMNKDILKILGILIDNSIEATENIGDKNISINMFIKRKNIEITVINTIKEDVNVRLANKSGYSTKGENRGYGLSIIGDIVNNNKNIEVKYLNQNNLFNAYIKAKI